MSNFQFSVVAGEELQPGRVVGYNGFYADNNDTSPAGVTSGFAELGEVVTLVNGGLYDCETSGAIAVGTPVMATTNGVLTALTGSDVAWVIGRAMSAATGNRAVIQISPYLKSGSLG
jgi:hypothetical protein